VIEKLNPPLHRETVARAALQLLAEIGLDGLTTRRVAAELNIQSPSWPLPKTISPRFSCKLILPLGRWGN
jgi:hypothetical protein